MADEIDTNTNAWVLLNASLRCLEHYERECLLASVPVLDTYAATRWAKAKEALVELREHHSELEAEALDAYIEQAS
jgi:alpha-ketoglutarate-dependent taurine dioxygenase